MDQQLKERLVGAVVLACAAVIVIPMVLSGRGDPPAPGAPPAAVAPSAGEPGFSSRIVPLERAGEPATGSPPPAERAPPPDPPKRAERAPPPDPPKRAEPAPAPAPPAPGPSRAAERETPRSGGWVVQLGSFSNARNARALRDRLRASGYRAFVQSTTSGGAKVTRVFVGPEPSREAAQRTVGGLLEQTRLKGIVVRNPAR